MQWRWTSYIYTKLQILMLLEVTDSVIRNQSIGYNITNIYYSFLKDLGVFIPPMNQGMRMDFFLEGPFMPNRIKLDRETLGGLADMFGQMPG